MRLLPIQVGIGTLVLLVSCSRHDAALDQALPIVPFPDVPTGTATNPLTAALLKAMSDRAGDFVGGPLVIDPQFARRSYDRGRVRISVTIAVPEATPLKYDEWVSLSAASPQVKLDVAPNSGSGFYDCADGNLDNACSVHIHLRSGHHIELMGEQNAVGRQFDALLAVLPLRDLPFR